MENNHILDISWRTILKVAVAVLGFYVLYLIKDILIIIIFSLVISILFNPAIDFLQRKKIPRLFGTILIYVLFFGFLGLLVYIIAPVFISEIVQFIQLFPQYFEKMTPPLKGLGLEAFESFETFTANFQNWLIKASASILSAIFAIFGGIFTTVTVFTMAIFLSLEEKGIEKALYVLTPKKYEASVLDIWKKSQTKISTWFGARILCCLFVALLSFFALLAFNVQYPFALSLFAGISNIVPIFGPIAAGILIALISFIQSWWKALFVLIAFVLIQQIEGNILSPILTKKFIGLPPALVLISLLVGGKLWGTMGAILAIPVAGILYEFLRDFLKKRKEEKAVIL
jgi:predicted PurR-regulated permease PerM